MHDAGAVDRGQGRGNADRELFKVRRRQRADLGDELRQRPTLDELGDQIRLFGIGCGVEYLGGAHPGHPAGRFGLQPETRPELVVVGHVGADHLDGDQPVGFAASEVDGSHSALAERAQQGVGTELAWVVRTQRGHLCVQGRIRRRHC